MGARTLKFEAQVVAQHRKDIVLLTITLAAAAFGAYEVIVTPDLPKLALTSILVVWLGVGVRVMMRYYEPPINFTSDDVTGGMRQRLRK
ncbi:hypothetical protein ACQEV2_07795 [Streptomyces sp. CA-251387]|uniref:hypothetical protein n=1 Tax=Streptomyces sp. CA-251387 TaxID=3240064 RepID=UPI003D8DFAE9